MAIWCGACKRGNIDDWEEHKKSPEHWRKVLGLSIGPAFIDLPVPRTAEEIDRREE